MKDDVEKSEEENLPLKEYLKINLMMWAFCLVVIGVSYILTDAVEVIAFLFGFLGVGFTLVSIYDWLFDRFVKEI
jgi:hypothetical protein